MPKLFIQTSKTEIDNLKTLETVEAKELPTHKAQSTTKENYMDYNNKLGSLNAESYVERKIFYKFQWDTMIETGVDSYNNFFKKQE